MPVALLPLPIARLLALLLLCLSATACEPQQARRAASPPESTRQDSPVVGTAAGSRFTLAETERAASLALHDIDMQRYRLLRSVLEASLLAELDTGTAKDKVAHIKLQPPQAPRLPVRGAPGRTRPEGDYPIEIVVFCNLESPHCGRWQQQLSHLLPLYPGVIQHAERNLVMPFHRHGRLAALAGYCAVAQEAYWQYRDFMVAGSGPPDRQRILSGGRAAGLSMDKFAACMANEQAAKRLQADAELASDLGVDAVPAVFVNGLYAGANAEPGHLLWLIDSELRRLGIDSPRMIAARQQSLEALKLDAVVAATGPGLGLAALAPVAQAQTPGFYREGELLGSQLTIRRVLADRVEILNRGVPEWIGFNGPQAPARREPPASDETDVDAEMPASLQYPHRAVPLTLDRTDVLVLMSDVAALEASLETVPLKAGGFQLLKVATVEPGGLYELLGLQPGDVIAMVNEQPMHEGDKPLWHALQTEDEVRLRVVRQGGLAHHYTYRFRD
ncbi:thioredoxin domain-containing protein [Seongchinamella sediminis]|nr:thioredoxin domain-containing protein [Seongchinamella sediminis]